jgi:malate synthase
VRPGIALSWAFKKHRHDGKSEDLKKLIEALIPESPQDQKDIWNFILEENVEGLKKEDPLYNRSLLAATIQHSPFGNNNDPEEVRYNIYQALQYLVDWLGGNGCVALPATLKSRKGENVFVRVMDDLATTERSRWEVWAEIFHGRFKKVDFLNLLKEEIDFIRNDKETDTKKIQVRWDDKTGKWYSVAIKVLIKLMTDKNPCEFATELLLPFTFDCVRNSNDPWSKASELDPKKYFLPEDILLFESKMNIKYNN